MRAPQPEGRDSPGPGGSRQRRTTSAGLGAPPARPRGAFALAVSAPGAPRLPLSPLGSSPRSAPRRRSRFRLSGPLPRLHSPLCGTRFLPLRTDPPRSRGGRGPPLKGFISLRKSALRAAAAHGSRPAEAPRRLGRAGGSRRHSLLSGSGPCLSGALEPGCPLSRPERPAGLPELEGAKLAVAPAPRLPRPGGRPTPSGPLLCPGRRASEREASAALDPAAPRRAPPPPRPAVLPAPPPPCPPAPRPPPRPPPGSPGVSAASWSLARPSRPALGSHLAPSRSPLPPPRPSLPLRLRAAHPSGPRATT